MVSRLGLPVLVDDILISILCHCDIPTVLNACLVSHRFYTLATSKAVWLVLLADLHRRGFIDLPPDQSLNQLSTQGLVDLVKRAVLGPKSWLTPDSTTPVAAARQIILNADFSDTAPLTEDHRRNQQILLQGGNYLLFRYDDPGTFRSHFECRDVRADRRIWEYEGHPDRWSGCTVQSFAAEIIDEGNTANLLLGIQTSDSYPGEKWETLRASLRTILMFDGLFYSFLEVVKLDLSSALDIFPSPIADDRSILWIHSVMRKYPECFEPPIVQISKYRIIHSASQPLSIVPLSSSEYTGVDCYIWRQWCRHLALSGFRKMNRWYLTGLSGPAEDVVISPTGRVTKLSLPNAGQHVHISPFSNALTYSTAKEIIIQYYD
ncbi:hypothetical protein DXG03_001293 [Asterophora parasitica]|uniref:F-box domain-containing protein n=1 Tax=Asterophora parasitica TaxID=117018 RepID=A0A9P7KAD7_9AGAR|nr:hypothetical protein DXG03_001293 [Asterophora parasitica]